MFCSNILTREEVFVFSKDDNGADGEGCVEEIFGIGETVPVGRLL